MRDRHIFWDIAPVGLLGAVVFCAILIVIQNERGWRVMQELKKEQSSIAGQNQRLLTMLADGVTIKGGVTFTNPGGTGNPGNGGMGHTPTTPNHVQTTRGPSMDHIPPEVELPVIPAVVRGDEGAPDGDWLMFSEDAEPNSLNPMIDNDATATDLFNRTHDPLASRLFDDYSVWEPRLAMAWSRQLICLAYVKDGKARELAEEIRKKWDKATLEKYRIKAIKAETVNNEEVLRIEISDVNNSYGQQLKADFGSRIESQSWFYVNFQGQFEVDGTTRLTAKAVADRVMAALKKIPDFKGRFLPVWPREDSVVVKMLGDEAARQAVDAELRKLIASPDNKALLLDPGSASGKREDKMLTYDVIEDYIAQEKPVFDFYLRKDVKWHDGEPFSGKDIVFTYNTMMNPQVESGPQRNYYQDCESVALVNDHPHIVRFTWAKPYFNAFVASVEFRPMAEHYYKFDDPKQFNTGKQNQWLVGNGLFKLDKWEREQRFVFVRNEQYYGRKPHVKGLIFKIVKDPSVELQLLEAGDIDLMGMRPSQLVAKEKTPEFKKRFNVDVTIANNYRYIGWNARDKKFADKRVRQALTMMIDRDRICKDIFRGYAIPQHGTVHPENPLYWKELEKIAWPYDPARAKKQLADSGWKDTDGDGILDKDGTAFRFTLLIPSGSPETEAVANLIKDSFAQAGIEVNINNLEWKSFLQKIERLQFDAMTLGWRLDLVEDPYQLWHSSQTDEKESNHCYFVNKEADRIIEACRRELDEEKRAKLLQRFQEIIHEEQPYTFLNVGKRIVASAKRIHNVKYRLLGGALDRWWVPIDEQKIKD